MRTEVERTIILKVTHNRMTTEIMTHAPAGLSLPGSLPALIADAGDKATWRFIEFFTATIRNKNTRDAYLRAVRRFFAWCEGRGLAHLHAIKPVIVAAYVEQFPASKPTVKQHLAAIRQCFDWLVSGGVLEVNPAASVLIELLRVLGSLVIEPVPRLMGFQVRFR